MLVWVSKDILKELVLSLYHMSSGNRVRVDILGINRLGTVVHAFNPYTQEAEAGRTL